MHPEKTRIVCCRNNNCKKDHIETHFTFLGFDFRRRQAVNGKTGQKFDSFQPAMSTQAYKAIKGVIKQKWNLRSKVHMKLKEIAQEVNPQIRGWINYYGKFYGTSLKKLYHHIDEAILRWAKRKHKKLRRRKSGSYEWLKQVKSKVPNLLVHWQLGKAY